MTKITKFEDWGFLAKGSGAENQAGGPAPGWKPSVEFMDNLGWYGAPRRWPAHRVADDHRADPGALPLADGSEIVGAPGTGMGRGQRGPAQGQASRPCLGTASGNRAATADDARSNCSRNASSTPWAVAWEASSGRGTTSTQWANSPVRWRG